MIANVLSKLSTRFIKKTWEIFIRESKQLILKRFITTLVDDHKKLKNC